MGEAAPWAPASSSTSRSNLLLWKPLPQGGGFLFPKSARPPGRAGPSPRGEGGPKGRMRGRHTERSRSIESPSHRLTAATAPFHKGAGRTLCAPTMVQLCRARLLAPPMGELSAKPTEGGTSQGPFRPLRGHLPHRGRRWRVHLRRARPPEPSPRGEGGPKGRMRGRRSAPSVRIRRRSHVVARPPRAPTQARH